MSKIIIFPTDTVYGIGCPIFDKEGIRKIYEIKQRSLDKPLACLCCSLQQIEEIAILNEKSKKLIQEFMPGALTLILPAKKIVTEQIGYTTIGVRIPNGGLALKLLRKMGPMLTTSVNESGKKALNDYEAIVSIYQPIVDEIYPAYEESSNVSSTIIDLTKEDPILLREGTLSFAEIIKVWKS